MNAKKNLFLRMQAKKSNSTLTRVMQEEYAYEVPESYQLRYFGTSKPEILSKIFLIYKLLKPEFK